MEREEEGEEAEADFKQARFPMEIEIPSTDHESLEAARMAIRREYRDASKWKRLRCRKVREVSESESGTIYELEIGHAVEFDWTWEGAVAFRPLLLKEFEDSQADIYQHGSLEPDVDDSIVWSGEVLEVDEAAGRIFIVVNNPEYPPRCGSFYVRPFEFLAFLNAVFNEPSFESIRQYLPARLSATTGGVHRYASLQQEFEAIGDYCRELICVQGVQPSDICLIYNGSNIPHWLEKSMMPRLSGTGVGLSVQTNKPFERSGNMLLATTSHSFKGYDSEVVIIPGVDQYKAQDKGLLANNLYVAMTRARSLLALFSQRMNDPNAKKLYQVIEDCLSHLEEAPDVDSEISPQDDIVELLEHIGSEYRKWLLDLWNKVRVSQEPLMTKTGEVIAEPLFSFRTGNQTYACFGVELPRKRVLQRLEDFGVKPIIAGDSITNV